MENHQVRGEESHVYEFGQPAMTHSVITSVQDDSLSLRANLARPHPFRLFSSQVRALYDFTGEAGTAELSITAGELLTVIRDNVGDGWCEGFNQSGQSGLFPAAYVQMVDQAAPSSSTCSCLYLEEHIYIE